MQITIGISSDIVNLRASPLGVRVTEVRSLDVQRRLPELLPRLPCFTRRGGKMIGIEEAATALGLTPRQVYRRISTVRPVLAPYIRRGENNAILLDGSAIEILRAVEDYRQRGETVEEAVRRVDIEINGNGKGERRETCGKPAEGLAEGLFRELLLEKDRTIEVLKEENERLRSEVDRLLPLALPAPRPRRWLFWRRQ